MKVLFVSSGNKKNAISPIIKNQGESLKKQNINLEYFTIKGKGIRGYLSSIIKLRKYLKSNSFDLVHVHYSLSAIVASLAGTKPLVVSLMGSDVKANNWFKWILYFFNYFLWSAVIVKSEDMYSSLGIKNAHIVPNGVNMDRFKPIDKDFSVDKIKWDRSKKHILFAAHPNRPEKNFKLTKDAFSMIDNNNIELHYLDNVSNDMMPYYYNAADVVMLTSLWEGSPNAIKEAMACNRPIVSTDVGDVQKIMDDVDGCFIAQNTKEDVSKQMIKALNYNTQTKGRKKIYYLDDMVIAEKIVKIYKEII